MKLRFLMPIAALAMASFAFTGCGGGDDPTPPAPPVNDDPPKVTLTTTPGYDDGRGEFFFPEVIGTINIKSDKAKSFRSILVDANSFDEMGAEIADILNEQSEVFSDKRYMTMVNGKDGYNMIYTRLKPGTRYYFLIEVSGAAGVEKAYEKKELKTAAAPAEAATDTYKAWLGTWKVVSAGTEVNATTPVTFPDVVITEYVANRYYLVSGWSMAGLRTEPGVEAMAIFDPETGNLDLINDQYIAPWSDDEIFNGLLSYTGRFDYTTESKYYLLSGLGSGIVATMNADKASAIGKGREFKLQSGEGPFVLTSIDYFIVDGDKIWGLNPADGFGEDYPVGPYTMTKTAGPAPASMISASNSIVAKSFVMSMMGKAGRQHRVASLR